MNSRTQNRRRERGSSTVEVALIGIPMIFVLISIFEMSRGMWIYHTLAYSVREGVRFASVHGINCVKNPPGVNNDCSKNISDVATVIQYTGVGLDTDKTLVTFTSGADVTNCYLGSSSNSVNGTLGTYPGCQSTNLTSTLWPPAASNENAVGKQIRIDIKTPFRSALAMLWPGSHGVSFAEADLGASSTDSIQF